MARKHARTRLIFSANNSREVAGRYLDNPPRAGQLMSREVLAVIYRHVMDPADVLRVHGFGDANLTLHTKHDGKTVVIDGLEEFTDVHMIAEPDGDVRLHHKHGASLWRDFQ